MTLKDVDESTGKRLSSLLKKEGFDVVFVREIMAGARDEQILAEAEKQQRINKGTRYIL
ncbi:MAG: DUF5615 family PIN-like protein [Candidatus Methanofastidiosia archaeon]